MNVASNRKLVAAALWGSVIATPIASAIIGWRAPPSCDQNATAAMLRLVVPVVIGMTLVVVTGRISSASPTARLLAIVLNAAAMFVVLLVGALLWLLASQCET